MIRDELLKIIEKYYSYNYYYRYRRIDEEDEDSEELDMVKEIKDFFFSRKIDYEIEIQFGYSSSGYDNDFLAIAWTENNKVYLETVLLEDM